MVERWDQDFPAVRTVLTAPPRREDVAWSIAHKLALIVAIITGIIALWGMTSAPAATQSTDATLGPPATSTSAGGGATGQR